MWKKKTFFIAEFRNFTTKKNSNHVIEWQVGANVIKPFSPSLKLQQNKLECFQWHVLVQASLIFSSKAGAYPGGELYAPPLLVGSWLYPEILG
jgi:hypothetical protein